MNENLIDHLEVYKITFFRILQLKSEIIFFPQTRKENGPRENISISGKQKNKMYLDNNSNELETEEEQQKQARAGVKIPNKIDRKRK